MGTRFDFQGVQVWKALLSRATQEEMVADLRGIADEAPFRQFETPNGNRMSVRMTGAGNLAWNSDRSGYAYVSVQPDGQPWPSIPSSIMNVWREVSGTQVEADSCLVNFYGERARMGLHQDRDEVDTRWPVVSISLGDDAQFRVGGSSRQDPTKSIWLQSGDIAVLSGASRLAYHGIDRIKFKSSTLLKNGGRINITLRIAS